MNEDQDSVGTWIGATFPGGDPSSARGALRALEEMVELCLACGASYQEVDDVVVGMIEEDSRRRYPCDWMYEDDTVWDYTAHMEAHHPAAEKVPAEAADVLIVLYGLAALRGFDLHAEVDRKMAINRSRRWDALGDGTGYHVKNN